MDHHRNTGIVIIIISMPRSFLSTSTGWVRVKVVFGLGDCSRDDCPQSRDLTAGQRSDNLAEHLYLPRQVQTALQKL
jgi:hypothetical protein